MKRIRTAVLVISLLLLCACKGSAASQQEGEEHEAVSVFPKTEAAWIGDTMPFYDDGTMYIFYLADQRDGKVGYHPWGLLRTKDYCNYENDGIVLPYGETGDDQDIALGTGCVIKDQNGLYHAFFTGHNDYRDPKEAIMHATSSDMHDWKKIPEDTFIANDHYSRDDFRDPYVLYIPEEQQYWMLIVTRSNNNGVIARYTSKDLSHWEDQGIFFEDDMGYGTNMECPTLIQFNNTWYLTFSDQWPDRVVHYRTSNSAKGPFVKPAHDTFDGSGFYAGRLETDGTNLYAVGWNGTKIKHDDANEYDWAGNMVVHQLAQREDGSLHAVENEKVAAALSHNVHAEPLKMSETISEKKNSYEFKGDQYELVQFDAFSDSGRMEVEITDYADDEMFGIAFAPDMDNVGTLNYVFNVKENKIEFYNTDRLMDSYAQSFMEYDLQKGEPLNISMYVNDGVVCVYVNDDIALTARMYWSAGTKWQIFGANADVKWNNLTVYD